MRVDGRALLDVPRITPRPLDVSQRTAHRCATHQSLCPDARSFTQEANLEFRQHRPRPGDRTVGESRAERRSGYRRDRLVHSGAGNRRFVSSRRGSRDNSHACVTRPGKAPRSFRWGRGLPRPVLLQLAQNGCSTLVTDCRGVLCTVPILLRHAFRRNPRMRACWVGCRRIDSHKKGGDLPSR